MARTSLDLHAFDRDVLDKAHSAFDLTYDALRGHLTDRNRDAVAAEIASAIAVLLKAGQRDREQLQRYAFSRGVVAASS